MTHITGRLTAKNRDQLRNPTLGNRVWANFTFLHTIWRSYRRDHRFFVVTGKGGNVTSAGWQVTLCDPMWHVSSRSGVASLRTAIHLLLTYFSLCVRLSVGETATHKSRRAGGIPVSSSSSSSRSSAGRKTREFASGDRHDSSTSVNC